MSSRFDKIKFTIAYSHYCKLYLLFTVYWVVFNMFANVRRALICWLNLLNATRQQITVMTKKQSLCRSLCMNNNRQDIEIYTDTTLNN